MNNIVKTLFIALLGTSALAALQSCAGPTTPLGAPWTILPVHAVDPDTVSDAIKEKEAFNPDAPRLKLTPSRQVLHGPSPVRLTIQDPSGDFRNSRLTVRYDGVDVSESFVRTAKRLDFPDQRAITFDSPGVRLGANKEHQIEFIYRNGMGIISRTVYEAPTCAAFKATPVVSTGDFDPPLYFVSAIDSAASQEGFNPAFLAGLIAQESSFNPKQVSWAKAVGLTQITSVAEAEVVEHFNRWPRYPGIDKMSYPRLKYMIASGRINSANEWRLNPVDSILGGAHFARQIAEKWAEKWNGTGALRRIASGFDDPETTYAQLILASYHSGYSRVATALEHYGKNWVRSPDLKEARKYIRRVFSYCSYFTDREVENARASEGA